jgi:hypothetical protein
MSLSVIPACMPAFHPHTSSGKMLRNECSGVIKMVDLFSDCLAALVTLGRRRRAGGDRRGDAEVSWERQQGDARRS